jgi:hypothetical protein
VRPVLGPGKSGLKPFEEVIAVCLRKSLPAIAIGFLLLVIGHVAPALAQTRATDDLPKIIRLGLEAYKAGGPEAAIKTWIKGSPIDGSKDALTQANNLRQIQDYYGAYKTFDVISIRNLSPNIRIVYLALDFEKGPLFAKFVVYQTPEGWILTTFNFNTKDELIIPPSI